MNRQQLLRDIFPRGEPEPIAEIKHPEWTATLYDLLTAYAAQRQHRVLASVRLAKRTVWSLAEARAALERLVGASHSDWSRSRRFLLSTSSIRAARDRARLELRGCARAGARGRARAASERGVRADLFAQARAPSRSWTQLLRPMRRSSKCKKENRAMASRLKCGYEDGRARWRRVRRRVPKNCGCWKRCCSLRLNRSTTRRWPSAARGRRREGRAEQLQADYALRGVNLVRVGNKWTFRTAGDLAWLMTRESDRDPQPVARRDRDARDHRLSPAGDARRDRGHPRRRHLEGHARRAAGDRLDQAARPSQGAGPSADLRHHRGLPVAFRRWNSSATCRAWRS